MNAIDIHEAQASFSQLIVAIESGEHAEIVIVRDGKPVAKLMALEKPTRIKIGLLKGKFTAPADFDALNEQIAKDFDGNLF